MKVQAQATLLCPHCGEEQDAVADDFAIAGRVGAVSAADSQCCSCDRWFSVERLSDGTMDVCE
jgi:sarcosine oxidase delta subunit